MRNILFLIFFTALSAQAIAQQEDIVIGETVTLYSKVLDEERNVMVHLPDNYSSGTEQYPVIYVLDGSVHFLHTVSSSQFLSNLNKAPGLIVVAITNTRRTRDMTTPDPKNERFTGNGGAENFASFIGTELIPFIDKNYRTEKYNILIGHSLAGFFTFYAMLNHPDLFDSYIAISPSLYWNEEQLVNQLEEVTEAGDSLNGILYLTYCREGASGIITATNNALRILESLKPPGLSWKFEYMPNEIHPSIPNRAVYEGLEFIFEGWSYDPTSKNADAGTMRKHYEGLSEKYGFTCRPAERWVNIVGYISLNSGRIPEAIEYFTYYTEMYPNSANAYDCLGEAYMKAGEKEPAITNYRKSILLNPENSNAVRMLEILRTGEK